MLITMTAINKGGSGKTTLSSHLAWRAQEAGWRVLGIDAGRQGDYYRRLAGPDSDDAYRPPVEWAPGCLVVHSPEEYDLEGIGDAYDLCIIDTDHALSLPSGQTPDFLLMPVDGIDAARGANETVAEALERGIEAGLIVFNRLDQGGKRYERAFDHIAGACPSGITVAGTRIPAGGNITRSAETCRPAWQTPWPGKDGKAMADLCDYLLGLFEQAKGE